MEAEFWHGAWREKRIGFHQAEVNAQLREYWPRLQVASGSRVLVPLCGKTRDMLWLRERHHVVGAELSPVAVEEFFAENALAHAITNRGGLAVYEGERLELWQGDFFTFPDEELARVSAVFDRAALVALPPDMRARYAQKLINTLPGGSAMLLITIEYDESLYTGPPFCITPAEVERLYGDAFSIDVLGSNEEDFKHMRVRNRAYALRRRDR